VVTTCPLFGVAARASPFPSPAAAANNTATATGDDAEAYAGIGDNNTATAIGEDSFAISGSGDNNTATANAKLPSRHPPPHIVTSSSPPPSAPCRVDPENAETAPQSGFRPMGAAGLEPATSSLSSWRSPD
jgi:hypothetical protein